MSTNVSLTTRRQADELVQKRGYTLRDVITVGVRLLYQEEFMRKKQISVSNETIVMVDALADVFELPEPEGDEILDKNRDRVINSVFKKILRETDNEHITAG